ncbi:MAG TPA: TIGR02996 domain-containing protein [Kofleriaceae bacterium]|nr:TIGR02996 domain-containing protein [Kofleriaceae bacterium]
MRARHPELEAQIVRDPDEPAGYLVYADWLMVCDDPRGELITLQVEHARAPSVETSERLALLFREPSLIPTLARSPVLAQLHTLDLSRMPPTHELMLALRAHHAAFARLATLRIDRGSGEHGSSTA